MGIDFGNLIKNLGATAASASGKTDKIDSKNELKEFVSGWDQIKAQAKQDAENSAVVDLQKEAQTQEEIDALAKAELNEIMGLDFAKNDLGIQKKSDMEKGTAFSDEEISLENLMALLEPEEGLDLAKVRENNEKPINIVEEMNVVENMNKFGFDPELTEVILEQAPEAAQYISDAIKDGSAKRIADDINTTQNDWKAAADIWNALKGLPHDGLAG